MNTEAAGYNRIDVEYGSVSVNIEAKTVNVSASFSFLFDAAERRRVAEEIVRKRNEARRASQREARRDALYGAQLGRVCAHTVLGVGCDADAALSRKAYRGMAKLNHPDTGPPAERAKRTDAMMMINRAYAAVSEGRH